MLVGYLLRGEEPHKAASAASTIVDNNDNSYSVRFEVLVEVCAV